MNPRKYRHAAFGAFCLAALPLSAALGHGEFDPEHLAEFHLHLDDYRQEVQDLIADLEPVVDAHRQGSPASAGVDELIEHWEEVAVHAAIETRATVLYPGVWQALVKLQQAVQRGADADAVDAAAAEVEAALWQGMGALRLAASRVGETSGPLVTAAPATGPETVAQILEDLESAVAAYGNDDLQRAERIIHDTYMNRFEGLEGDLIERDPELVAKLERDFNATLPLLMQEGASMERVDRALESMRAQLETAGDLLREVEATRSEVF